MQLAGNINDLLKLITNIFKLSMFNRTSTYVTNVDPIKTGTTL